MRDGADVIYQAPLVRSRWHGRADFLRKVERPSDLGAWSYEVTDAKLATETRAGTILQLCVYSSLLGGCRAPCRRKRTSLRRTIASCRKATGSTTTRRITGSWKSGLEAALEERDAVTYPEPAQHCDVCDWWCSCNARRRADDHSASSPASAGCRSRSCARARRRHSRAARRPRSRAQADARLARSAHAHARSGCDPAQARAHTSAPARRLPLGPEHGFLRPAGAGARRPLSRPRRRPLGARGWARVFVRHQRARARRLHPLWATDPAEEKRAFERVVDRILAAFEADRAMHVYHFGAYEPTAFKRLWGGTRRARRARHHPARRAVRRLAHDRAALADAPASKRTR